MTNRISNHFSLKFWNQFMGKDIPQSRIQPLQPVMIENGKMKLFTGTLTSRFPAGSKVGLKMRGNRIIIEEAADGEPIQEASFWDEEKHHELRLPDVIQGVLPQQQPHSGMIVDSQDCLQFMPISVQEHDPDILGPRIIDELRYPSDETQPVILVRHIVRGFKYEDWTNERLHELEKLVCSKPFSYDPLRELKVGEDWINWKVRNEILQQPDPNDGKLRLDLMDEIFAGQIENGSWGGHVVETAYGILRALSIHVPSDDARIQKAAHWLLKWPQPVGRPGMWMQTEEHLQEWNKIKNGEIETDRDSYIEFEPFTEEDHNLYRREGRQQVIPTCCRNFEAVCYSRMLHPSATVAYALCRCGYSEHPRVRDYADTMLQVGGMFGYFCACWGIVDFDVDV